MLLHSEDKTEREKVYRKILEAYQGNILCLNKQGHIEFVNRQGAATVGRTIEKVVEENLTIDEIEAKNILINSAAGRALRTGEKTMAYITGSIRENVTSFGVPVFNDNGEMEYAVSYSLEEGFFKEMAMILQKSIEEKYHAEQLVSHFSNQAKENQVVAESARIKEILEMFRNISSFKSTVLLLGESGVGKEVYARYIFDYSQINKSSYLTVNCAAIPENLVESELFGYEGGAFTGAKKQGHMGLFEMADKGTLFLDEIGDMPLQIQSKLLRVLETGEVTRISGRTPKKVDVRIITATNKDLEQMVREKKFREDLYYRINVFNVRIPPIRERTEDIRPLIHFFLDRYNKKYGLHRFFSECTMELFEAYDWPGNVREIRNIVERSVISSRGNKMTLDDLDFKKTLNGKNEDHSPVTPNKSDNIVTRAFNAPLKEAMKDFEKQYIERVYRDCGLNVTLTAQKLGVHKTGLYKKLKEYELV